MLGELRLKSSFIVERHSCIAVAHYPLPSLFSFLVISEKKNPTQVHFESMSAEHKTDISKVFHNNKETITSLIPSESPWRGILLQCFYILFSIYAQCLSEWGRLRVSQREANTDRDNETAVDRVYPTAHRSHRNLNPLMDWILHFFLAQWAVTNCLYNRGHDRGPVLFYLHPQQQGIGIRLQHKYIFSSRPASASSHNNLYQFNEKNLIRIQMKSLFEKTDKHHSSNE